MITIGIDPGITGAVAFLSDRGGLLAVIDMPTATKGTKTVVDGRILAMHMLRLSEQKIIELVETRAIIEDVSTRPGEGHVGAFSFGHAVGTVEGVLCCLGIPFRRINPVRWKRMIGIAPGSGKSASISMARAICPASAKWLTLKKHHGRADAILIAHCSGM